MHRAHELVAPQLALVEETLLSLPDMHPASLRKAVETIVASGGKRLRPLMTLLVAGMFGNLNERKVIDVAAAVEMLHTATLVHDDLIDGSLVRRGAATLNAAWTPVTTVLTGDYLMAFAARLAARGHNVRVMDIFAETLGIVVGGELRQAFTDWARRRTRADYEQRIYAKTASMFVLAVTSAGVLSGASDAHIRALNEFGTQFGNAFQVIDDVLDFTADQNKLGKPVGSDLRRGLITLPTICYIEANAGIDMSCALAGECSSEQYDDLIERIRKSDAIGEAINEARIMAERAKRALEIFPDSPYRAELIALTESQVAREK
jgi:geranylgeranyl pyrophosphate synthase